MTQYYFTNYTTPRLEGVFTKSMFGTSKNISIDDVTGLNEELSNVIQADTTLTLTNKTIVANNNVLQNKLNTIIK